MAKKQKVNIVMGGVTYNLDTLIEASQEVCLNVEEAVASIERMLAHYFQKDEINDIMNKVKRRFVELHSDEYDYIPDEGEDYTELYYEKDRVKSTLSVGIMMLAIGIGLLLAGFAIFFMTQLISSDNTPVEISTTLETIDKPSTSKEMKGL